MALKLIGTSHIAGKSVTEVSLQIKDTKPDIVAIELDKDRLGALLSGNTGVPFSSIKKLGFFGFLFAKLGNYIQGKLGDKTGIVPGSEMKTALVAASAVKAEVVLIDQPILITIQKLAKISMREKLALLFVLLFGWMPGSRKIQFKLESIPNERETELLLAEFRNMFPETYKILVEERNAYMAKQLHALDFNFQGLKILAIVGAGHVSGIRKRIKSLEDKQKYGLQKTHKA